MSRAIEVQFNPQGLARCLSAAQFLYRQGNDDNIYHRRALSFFTVMIAIYKVPFTMQRLLKYEKFSIFSRPFSSGES
jgi:hypothetical protein